MHTGWLRRYPATLSILALIFSVYIAQLVIAGSLEFATAYKTASELSLFAYSLFTPWLHSTHYHVLENAALFALLGWWMEKRIPSPEFGGGVLLIGYSTNLIPALLGFGGLGLGASGITNALAAFYAAFHISMYARTVGQDTIDVRKVVIHLVLFGLGLLLVLKSIAEFFGFLTPPSGTATGGHLLGVILGLSWFILRQAGFKLQYEKKTQAS